MATVMQTRIEGSFSGFNGDAIFRLSNGQVWQQARYRYRYKYAYRPIVEIKRVGVGYLMDVPCMGEAIEVRRVSILCDGAIVSDFAGFNGGSTFEFDNRQIWEQAEYKYSYHYAYRPQATVIDGSGGPTLQVDGMGETVQVRRLR